METPEMANMRAAQEYNTAEKHAHQRVDSVHLLAEMFGCSVDEVEIMLSLLRIHGVYEIVEAVEDFKADTPLRWSFGTIVIAAKNVTLKELYGRIDNDLHRKLETVTVSTQSTIYGTALTGDTGLDEETLMIFTDMIKYGVTLDRMSAIDRAYIDMGAFYGGHQDEPDEDVDIDRLLDGIAGMMERHGIRGDVRAKAKEFFGAVAANTLNEVIHEE